MFCKGALSIKGVMYFILLKLIARSGTIKRHKKLTCSVTVHQNGDLQAYLMLLLMNS